MAQKRAKVGGEVAVNGEFYKGGAFIATTEHAKGGPRPKASRKQEIEPHKWEVPPAGMISIWRLLGPGAGLNCRTMELNLPYLVGYERRTPEEIARLETLLARWKAGERWTEERAA